MRITQRGQVTIPEPDPPERRTSARHGSRVRPRQGGRSTSSSRRPESDPEREARRRGARRNARQRDAQDDDRGDHGAHERRMNPILVDSNVLLDVMTDDPDWADQSRTAVVSLSAHRQLVINTIIFAEVSISFDRIEDVDESIADRRVSPRGHAIRSRLSRRQGLCRYRKRGGATDDRRCPTSSSVRMRPCAATTSHARPRTDFAAISRR